MATEHADVVIIGAGLAGAAAAAWLGERGLAVVVLEARDRVGGRGFARPFAGTDELLDFGGSWITPWQHTIRGLCERHGIALRPRHPVTARRWFRDGALHHDGPVAMQDLRAHERALARIAADSAFVLKGITQDEQERSLIGISFAGYLDRIAAPQATKDLCTAWWTVSGNGAHDVVPAAEFLHACTHSDNTPEGICECWADSLVGGVMALCARLIDASGARLELDCPVQRVRHNGDGATIAHARGSLQAKAVLLATGLNPLQGIVFDPPLPEPKAAAVAMGHPGRAVKLWARVTGVPVGVLGTGGGTGIEWLFAERALADGTTLLVGFGLASPALDLARRSDVAAAVARFFPEAELISYDWHDWIADPWSRGTWVASTLGAEAATGYANWSRTGRLAFASSDLAEEGAGWFDAAATSGEAAAREIAQLLGRNAV